MNTSEEKSGAHGPLHGVTVVEAAMFLAGPYAGMLLADLGAEVVKVEPVGTGDPFRGWEHDGYSPTFCSVNRNKKSVAVDLKSPAGREVLQKLIARADVLIQNFRPDAAARLGIDYPATQPINPRLIYCAISGFGETGPYRDRPGYDTVGQAMGGLLGLITDMESPAPVGISLSDHVTGLFACQGILAALYHRQATGRGQRVATSLLQSTIAFTQEAGARYQATGKPPSRRTRVAAAQVFAFVAKDGLPMVVHLSSPAKFWEGLTEAIGRADLRGDERFKDRPGRIRHYEELRKILEKVFASDTRAAWLARLGSGDVPCAPINTMAEVYADPQAQALGACVEMEHPKMGKVKLARSALEMGDSPAEYRSAPPTLGEHTEEVLRGLGYDEAAIEQMRRDGVI